MDKEILIMLKKEVLPFATTWMNLEDIMLSEINQTQKDKYSPISLIDGMSKSQIHRNREMNGGYQGRGGGGYGEMLVKEHKGTVL